MNLSDLELNHSVELDITINGSKATMLTTLEQTVSGSALLAPILLHEKLVGFPPSCNVNFIYPDNDRVYVWYNVTVKAVRYEKKVYHSVELVGDAETMNRRGAYRVFIGEHMNIVMFTSEGPKPLDVLVKDISENGFAFLTPEEFDTGRILRLNLKAGGGVLKLSAQIVRKQAPDERGEILYGCKFSEHNNFLSSYLMKLQQQRQKEKLETFSMLT